MKGPPFMSTADDVGDSLQPLFPNNFCDSNTLDASAGLSAGGTCRPRCGRASAEFLCGNGLVGQVGQLGALYAPTQPVVPQVGVLPQGMQGMLGGREGGLVGNLPFGGIGQIPEHSEGQVGLNGQFVPKAAPRITGPINRLIGPLPTSHEAPAPNPIQYGVGGIPAGMHSMVGTYPAVGQVGQVPSYSVGGYPVHSQHQYQAPGSFPAGGIPVGGIGQVDDRARRATYPNSFGMHQKAAEARQLFHQQSGGPPVSHIGTTSREMSDGASSSRNVGEISQQSLANSLRAPKVSGVGDSNHESPRSHEVSQVLHYLMDWQAPQHRPQDQYYNTNSYPQQAQPSDRVPHYSGVWPPSHSVSHFKISRIGPGPHLCMLPCPLTCGCHAVSAPSRAWLPASDLSHGLQALCVPSG